MTITYTFHAKRIQLTLSPAERAAIGAPANHNAAAEVEVVKYSPTVLGEVVSTFFYSWEQGTMTLVQITAAIRLVAVAARDAAIAASVPATTEALVGVKFPL